MGVVIPGGGFSEDRASGAQVIDGGLRFDSSKTHYLNKSFGSAGNQKKWTFSCWLRRFKVNDTGEFTIFATPLSNNFQAYFGTTLGSYADTLQIGSDPSGYYRISNAVFRDVSAWYNFVFTLDTDNATPNDRLKVWVNGSELSWQVNNTITQGASLDWNSAREHNIGRRPDLYFNGSMSQVYFIDGQALTPSYFGYTDPLTNTWRPKKFSGSLALETASLFTLSDSDFSANDLRSGSNAVTSGVLTDGTLNYNQTFYGNNGANGAYLDIDMTGSSTGEVFLVRYWNAAEAGGQTITATCKQVDSGGNDIAGTSVSQTWTQGQKWNDGSGYIQQTIQSNTSKIRLIFSGNSNNSFGWGIGEVQVEQLRLNQNSFHLPFDGSAPIGQDQSGRGNDWTPVNFGGYSSLEKATGALPILNTDGGGKVARPGTRTDESASDIVLALPLVGNKEDVSAIVKGSGSNKTITSVNAVASSTQSNFYGGSWYFDGTGDYVNIPQSTDFDFGSGDCTVECWLYITSHGSDSTIAGRWEVSDQAWQLSYAVGTGNSKFAFSQNIGGTQTAESSVASAGYVNRWVHLAGQRVGNTLQIYVNGVLEGTKSVSGSHSALSGDIKVGGRTSGNYITGYIQDFRVYKGTAKYTSNFIPASTDPDIVPDSPSGVSYSSNVALVPSTDGAVAFDGTDDYLKFVDNADFAFGTGDFTVECFIYPTANASYQAIIDCRDATTQATGWVLGVDANDNIYIYNDGFLLQSGSGVTPENRWFHVAYVRNSGVHALYVDGKSVATSSSSYDYTVDSCVIGASYAKNSEYWDGFISNLHIVKGTALYTSNFTPPTEPLTAVANTKLLCCKSPTSAVAFDVSPGTITAVNAKATNFNPFTDDIDTQRGKQSGYATLNPLDIGGGTLSNGNLDHTYNSSNIRVRANTNIPTTGKWYAEFVASNAGGGNSLMGVSTGSSPLTGTNWYVGADANSWGCQVGSGTMYTYNNGSFTSFGTAAAGDIISVAVDRAAGSIWWAVNGIWIGGGNPTNGTNARYSNIPSTGDLFFTISNANNSSISCNFGQKPFKFPPPAGFQPLTLANLPRPTIVRPDQYVGIVTYSGDGNSGRKVTGLNFNSKPDLVWIKVRNEVNSHYIFDTVRGADKALFSDLTDDENDYSGSGGRMPSFDYNGFTVNYSSSTGTNASGDNYVAWCWKAGGNSNTFNIDDVGYDTASAAGLTAGTITPTGASVNTKSGFSIITYTGNGTSGATISHGLQKTPSLLIVKRRSSVGSTANWAVWHSSLTAGNNLFLNTTDNAQAYTPSRFTSTIPTSSVFSLGGGDETNYNTGTFVAYSWAEIPGFSKFGSYTHNNSADGPFIELGFKPALILIKKYNVAGRSWVFIDSERDKFNVAKYNLWPNLTNGDVTTYDVLDILSNGFKVRTNTNGWVGESTDQYIYAAWAEAPSINLYGSQANAR